MNQCTGLLSWKTFTPIFFKKAKSTEKQVLNHNTYIIMLINSIPDYFNIAIMPLKTLSIATTLFIMISSILVNEFLPCYYGPFSLNLVEDMFFHKIEILMLLSIFWFVVYLLITVRCPKCGYHLFPHNFSFDLIPDSCPKCKLGFYFTTPVKEKTNYSINLKLYYLITQLKIHLNQFKFFVVMLITYPIIIEFVLYLLWLVTKWNSLPRYFINSLDLGFVAFCWIVGFLFLLVLDYDRAFLPRCEHCLSLIYQDYIYLKNHNLMNKFIHPAGILKTLNITSCPTCNEKVDYDNIKYLYDDRKKLAAERFEASLEEKQREKRGKSKKFNGEADT